jgi:vancomycin resistance protein YoaR
VTDQPTSVGDAPAEQMRPQDAGETRKPSWRRRRWVIVVGAVLVGACALYLLAYLVAGRDLPSGATVLGVEIGDLSRAEAEAKLTKELPAIVNTPIPVRVADEEQTSSLAPEQSGLAVDYEATVDSVPGRSANPVSLVSALFGAGEIDPVPTVDRPALEKAITAIAEQVDTEPVNGSIAFKDGAVVTSEAAPGRLLDVERSADEIETAFFGRPGPHSLPLPTVDLPVNEVEADVTDADVDDAVRTFAEPAMSAPVTVAAGDRTTKLDPSAIGAALTLAPDDEGVLTPALDGAALVAAAGDALDELGQAGQDATVHIEGGRPVITAGASGQGVDPKALAAAVLDVLTETGTARTAQVELTEVEPELTSGEARELGVKAVVSEFTTRFPHASYRNTNIGLALRRIDNTLLQPGEVFSLNALVGERNAANGFAVGWTIDGGRLKKDYGGGVSQVATTTYHAAFRAGFEDVYHQPHSIYFDRYPVGQEATVSWGDFDMSFKNDTPYGALIDTSFSPSGNTPGTVTVRIWSTKYFRVETSVSGRSGYTSPQTVYDTSNECEPQRGWQGFSITSYRQVWTPDGKLDKDEAFPWTYKPNPNVICGPDPGVREPGR